MTTRLSTPPTQRPRLFPLSGLTPYSRELACYPATGESVHGADPRVASKYWMPVGRVDQAYGDRNLVCACPPIEAFASGETVSTG
jgi:hypothetical protein